MRKHKIRYILGAGASAPQLPIVKDFNDAVSGYREAIEVFLHYDQHKKDLLESVLEDLKFFEKQLKAAFSIDTLARFYWLRDDRVNYLKVKKLISMILFFEQVENGVNTRYDAFLAALLNKNTKTISEEIQIVNWNYDTQFAASWCKVWDLDIVDFDQNSLSLSRINGEIYSKVPSGINHSEFLINSARPELNYKVKLIHKYLPYIVKLNRTTLKEWNGDNHLVSFAWENTLSLKETNSLRKFYPTCTVVIGYSFPTYNRVTDNLLLKDQNWKMTDSKIYLQCNYWDEKNDRIVNGNREVASKLLGFGIPQKCIVDVEDSKEFHIPFELGKIIQTKISITGTIIT